MDLNKKLKEYAGLKRMKVGIEVRLSELNQQIKKELTHPKYAKDGTTFRYDKNDIWAEVKVKTTRDYDSGLLEDLLWKKGLWEKCTRRTIDDDLVEQAYLSGELSDEDLRQVKKNKLQTALSVGENDGV